MAAPKRSAAENLLELINPTPVIFDPEDDNDQETTAKVVENYFQDDFNDEEADVLSSFRKQNLELLEHERYTGMKISRDSLKSLSKSGTETELAGVYSSSASSDDEAGSNVSHEDSDIDNKLNESSHVSSIDEYLSDESDGDSKTGDKESGEEDGDEEETDDLDSQDNSFQHVGAKSIESEIEKGTAVRNQLNVWDKLLECRIQFQKSLLAANSLPQSDTFHEFKSVAGPKFASEVEKTKQTVTTLLEKLMQLRTKMLHTYSETKNLGQMKKDVKADNDMDEEIPSSDEEIEDPKPIEEVTEEMPKVKKRKLNDYAVTLADHHNQFKEYRNSTIQKWNDRTRVAVGSVTSRNFSAFEQSTVKQIEHILNNRQRLIRRTQMKRSNYAVLGQQAVTKKDKETEVSVADVKPEKADDIVKECDVEIFDDTDFYHQLLRELIERKSADVTDPIQLGKQWVQIQKLRSKMKRKVDTRATKGRKIRFVVLPKLVNFMAPISESTWTEEAQNELYNSLFGKS